MTDYWLHILKICNRLQLIMIYRLRLPQAWCTAKTQISLGIRPVWSESSLSAWRKHKSLATHWAQWRLWSDWADINDLSLCWAHIILLVFPWGGSSVSQCPVSVPDLPPAVPVCQPHCLASPWRHISHSGAPYHPGCWTQAESTMYVHILDSEFVNVLH